MNTVKSFAWSFLEQAGAKAVTLIVQIVLARILTPEEFGVLAILMVFVTIVDSIAQSGLGTALIQKKDADITDYSSAFWLSIGLSILLYVMLYFVSPYIALFYEMSTLTDYLRVIGIVVLFNSINSIFRSSLQKKMEFKKIFVISLISTIGSGVLGIFTAIKGFGTWALIFQVISQSLLNVFVSIFLIKWKPKFVFSGARAKGLFSFGWKMCVTGILYVFYNGFSELIIGKTCSSSALGYYTQGRRYPNTAINVLSNAIQNVLFPAFSTMQNDKERLKKAMRKALIVGSFVIVPISFLLIAAAKPLVVILLTEKWLPCVLVFQITCLSQCIAMVQMVSLRAYTALGYSTLYLQLQAIKLVSLLIFGGATAIITQNIYLVAGVICIGTIATVIIVDLQPAKKILGYGRVEQMKDWLPIVGIALLAYIPSSLCGWLSVPYWAMLILQILIYGMVYLVLAKVFKISALTELISISKRLLKN